LKKLIYILAFLPFILQCCKKDDGKFLTHANEIFWLTNAGADMPVWVKGNTASKVFIVVVHGGPGDGAYGYSGFQTETLQEHYAMVFWDQRNAGSSAGNSNFNNLSLDQMVDDLEKLIKVLKYRYGNNISVFLYGHSFGGLLGSAFLSKDNYQEDLKGWIEIDGAHNYPLTDSSSRRMLVDTGRSEISKGKNIAKWTEIVEYCESHDPLTSLAISYQIESYAHEAENYVDINHQQDPLDLTSPANPLSILANQLKLDQTSSGEQFLQSLEKASYSNQLYKIKIPSLLLWGQYDFTVPKGVAMDAYNNLGSFYKKLVMFPHSGHRPMDGDTEPVENTIIDFVESFK
jgi:pimeloyl-ACP methyl ester carboxylesterase